MVEFIVVGVCFGAIKDNSLEKVEQTPSLLKFTSSPKFKSMLVCILCGVFMIYPLIIFILGISWVASVILLKGLGIFFIVYSLIEAAIGGLVLSILLGVMTQTEVVLDKVAKTMTIVSRKAMCCLCFGSVEKTFSFNDITKIVQIDDAICCNQGAKGFTVCTNQENYTPTRANVNMSYILQMQEFVQRAKFEEANPGAIYPGPNPVVVVVQGGAYPYPLQGYALPPGAPGVAVVPGGAYPGYPPQGYALPPGAPNVAVVPGGAYPGYPPQGYPPQAFPPQTAAAAAASQDKPPQEDAPPAAPAGSD